MLVGFFAGCIQPPILTVEVQFEGAPCRAQTMRFQGKIRQEGVLHFGGPHMLPAVANVEVVERRHPWFFRKERQFQVASVALFEIESKRLLGLGT